MKRILAIALSVALVGAVGLIFLLSYFDDVYWKSQSQKTSPNGNFIVHEYAYSSDSDRHAPYGTYLLLLPTKSFEDPKEGYVIFAGYCVAPIAYSWLSNEDIHITCESDEPDNIRTLSSKAFGVRISVSPRSS